MSQLVLCLLLIFAFPLCGALTDISVSKTDGLSTLIPGTSTTWTIVVSNIGRAAATSVSVTDTIPPEVDSFSWVCTAGSGSSCGALTSGATSITVFDVSIAAGSNVNYKVIGAINPAARGKFGNLVDALFSGDNGSDSNNVAFDGAILTAVADLSVTKADNSGGDSSVGSLLTYSIQVLNPGPSEVDAGEVRVVDTFPVYLQNVQWTCTASANSDCGAASSGTGNIDQSDVVVGASGFLKYEVVGKISTAASVSYLMNVASAIIIGGVTDSNIFNNWAYAYTALNSFSATPLPPSTTRTKTRSKSPTSVVSLSSAVTRTKSKSRTRTPSASFEVSISLTHTVTKTKSKTASRTKVSPSRTRSKTRTKSRTKTRSKSASKTKSKTRSRSRSRAI